MEDTILLIVIVYYGYRVCMSKGTGHIAILDTDLHTVHGLLRVVPK